MPCHLMVPSHYMNKLWLIIDMIHERNTIWSCGLMATKCMCSDPFLLNWVIIFSIFMTTGCIKCQIFHSYIIHDILQVSRAATKGQALFLCPTEQNWRKSLGKPNINFIPFLRRSYLHVNWGGRSLICGMKILQARGSHVPQKCYSQNE